MSSVPIRLFIVDDHPVVRSGLKSFLAAEPGLVIVGEAANGQELLDQLPTTPTDVVLLDLNMPVLDGLATTQRLRVAFPAVRVVILSMLSHEHRVSQLLAAGALGYTLKNDGLDEIALAVRAAAAGRQYLCSELSLLLLRKVLATSAVPPAPNPYRFSPRELDVLQLLSEGFTTSEIATRLLTSRRTIETHRQHLLDKSKTRNVAMLIRVAMAQGLLS